MTHNKIIVTNELERSFVLCKPLLKRGLETKVVSDDGRSLIEEINRVKPSAVLLPSFMPLSDAVGVIHLAKTMRVGENTLYFVVGSGEGLKTINYIMNSGADYYFHMSTHSDVIAEKIRSFLDSSAGDGAGHSNGEASINAALTDLLIRDFLRKAGIPPHLKGFAYLEKALQLELAGGKGPLALTKHIYPFIAKTFGTTDLRVERDIRNAVAAAWNDCVKNGTQFENIIFSKCASRPSNREFLGLTLFELRRNLLHRTKAIS